MIVAPRSVSIGCAKRGTRAVSYGVNLLYIGVMFLQILIGSIVVGLTIMVEAAFVSIASIVLSRKNDWIARGPDALKITFVLAAVVIWLLGAISVVIWIWAGLFLALGVFSALEPALYFSAVTFTTLGYGDIVVGSEWRLLTGIVAANCWLRRF